MSVEELVEWARAVRSYVDALRDVQQALERRMDAELAEIRDGMIELDHRIAALQPGELMDSLLNNSRKAYQRQLRSAHDELRRLRGES